MLPQPTEQSNLKRFIRAAAKTHYSMQWVNMQDIKNYTQIKVGKNISKISNMESVINGLVSWEMMTFAFENILYILESNLIQSNPSITTS